MASTYRSQGLQQKAFLLLKKFIKLNRLADRNKIRNLIAEKHRMAHLTRSVLGAWKA